MISFWYSYTEWKYISSMKYFHTKVSMVYGLKNELKVAGIYNYHGFFLLLEGSIYKISSHIFCYNFT